MADDVQTLRAPVIDTAGHIDLCGPDLVEGWIFCRGEHRQALRLQVFLDGVLLGECAADRFRQDLSIAGFGDGRCAYSFRIPQETTVKDYGSVRLRVAGSVLFLLPDEYTSLP